MITKARLELDRAEAGHKPDLVGIPKFQWDVYFPMLSKICPHYKSVDVQRRPGNALNIEIGAPAPRCMMRPPDGRGVTKDGSNLAWLLSGGSVLNYGVCEHRHCWMQRQNAEATP